jgi:hypothetical protein
MLLNKEGTMFKKLQRIDFRQLNKYVGRGALAALVCIGLLGSSFGFDTARADVINGVSPIFEIYSDSLTNYYMVAAFNTGTASYLVAWITQQDANTTDLWARPVFMDGKVGAVFNIDTSASYYMSFPALAADPTRARFLVAYHSEDTTGWNSLLARTVSYDGSLISSAITIMGGEPMYISTPSVAYNPQLDEFLVVYDDTSDPTCGHSRLYAVRINAETMTVITAVEIGSCTTDEYSYQGNVALHPSNQYQLVYTQYDNVNSTYYLLTRWLSADLSQMGAPVEMNNSKSNIEKVLVASGTGSYLAVYLGIDASSHMQIYGQFIGIDGNVMGGPIQIPVTMDDPAGVWFPSVAFRGSLGYVVSWGFVKTSDPGDDPDLYYRLVPERPEPPTTPEMVLADGTGDQGYPVVSCALGMQCLMVFHDDQSGDRDIYGRMIFQMRQVLPIVRK